MKASRAAAEFSFIVPGVYYICRFSALGGSFHSGRSWGRVDGERGPPQPARPATRRPTQPRGAAAGPQTSRAQLQTLSAHLPLLAGSSQSPPRLSCIAAARATALQSGSRGGETVVARRGPSAARHRGYFPRTRRHYRAHVRVVIGERAAAGSGRGGPLLATGQAPATGGSVRRRPRLPAAPAALARQRRSPRAAPRTPDSY